MSPYAIDDDGSIRRLPPPLREHGPTEEELMRGYCKSGCTTPPTVVVEGEPVCRQCAREMGA